MRRLGLLAGAIALGVLPLTAGGASIAVAVAGQTGLLAGNGRLDHDGDADRSTLTVYTEDNDRDGVANCPDPLGDLDNRHPSGADRHCEAGGSGIQGQSESNPDGASNGGVDKPNGTGGIDQLDQDGNNGCGNDDDFEDDNNGNCGNQVEHPTPEAIGLWVKAECHKVHAGSRQDLDLVEVTLANGVTETFGDAVVNHSFSMNFPDVVVSAVAESGGTRVTDQAPGDCGSGGEGSHPVLHVRATCDEVNVSSSADVDSLDVVFADGTRRHFGDDEVGTSVSQRFDKPVASATAVAGDLQASDNAPANCGNPSGPPSGGAPQIELRAECHAVAVSSTHDIDLVEVTFKGGDKDVFGDAVVDRSFTMTFEDQVASVSATSAGRTVTADAPSSCGTPGGGTPPPSTPPTTPPTTPPVTTPPTTTPPVTTPPVVTPTPPAGQVPPAEVAGGNQNQPGDTEVLGVSLQRPAAEAEVAAAQVQRGPDSLPFTGIAAGMLALMSLGLTVLGVSMLLGARRASD